MPMTDSEFSEFRKGMKYAFYCPQCKHHDIYDDSNVNTGLDEKITPEQYEDYTIKIDYYTVEDLIERAVEKRCFIEVIALVHNVVELYLKSEFRKYWFNEISSNYLSIPFKERFDKLLASEELFNTFINSKRESVDNYLKLCIKFKLIEREKQILITEFNEQRNKIIHELLKKNKTLKYSDIILTAKLGRQIQLLLSPNSFNEEEQKNILAKFDITDEEKKNDIFLR